MDALVADDGGGDDRPPVPALSSFGAPTGVPSFPPGLGHAHAVVAAAVPLPLAGGYPAGRGPPAATPLSRGAAADPGGSSEAKKTIKALAVTSGLSKDIASHSRPSKSKAVLQDEDFPALDTSKPAAVEAALPAVPALPKVPGGKAPLAQGKKSAAETAATPNPKAEPRRREKKPAPQTLNISAAVKGAAAKPAETPSSADLASFPVLPAAVAGSLPSPVTRAAPKTLRVVPTPKGEVPPATGGSSTAVAEAKASGVSSVLSSNRPGTPASEVISDNVSVVSASISASRTSSPPPSRIGSAAVRATTKSQQRKQRKQVTKSESATLASQPLPEPEPEIAPILGRKKKQKKEKPASATAAAPAAETSRRETPAPQPAPMEKPPVKTLTPEADKPAEKATQKAKTAKHAAPGPSKGKEREVEKPVAATPAVPVVPVAEADPGPATRVPPKEANAPENLAPTPLSIFQELVANGDIADPEKLSLLKPSFAPSPRGDAKEGLGAAGAANGGVPGVSILSRADQLALHANRVVRKTVDGVRVMATPNGDWLRSLTEEEEDRFLALQVQFDASAASACAYVHPRHEAPGGFSLVKGRAVSNGTPSYLPQTPGLYEFDPMTKIQRGEAISYINQYVLPRLNATNSDAPVAAVAAGSQRDWKSAFVDSVAGLSAQESSLASAAPWIYNSMLNSGEPAMDTFGALDDMHHLAGLQLPDPATAAGAVLASLRGISGGGSAAAAPANTAGAADRGGLPTYLTGTAAASASLAALGSGNLPLLNFEDAEAALAVARRETEKLEKSLAQVVKKNRRILLPTGGAH